MKRNIVLLGAPGAGKGTQAVKIAAAYGIPHISTGDIFRKNIKEETELGKRAKAYLDGGLLVPDEIVIGIVESRLKEADALNGYVLDGFPRTLPQAEGLDKITDIDIAINLTVDFDVIITRLSGRRVCACGENSHISWLGGSEICPKCGKKMFIRDDDKPETVKARLDVYQKQTAPLIEYYQRKGLLVEIESYSVEETFKDVEKALQ
ncbi:MAG: adenylate kinase [Christensenellales bacterium]|jgi:adenylate kinase|nr:adenylate kinase [Clostridia bacterium]HRU83845.1 adenylate kinase [Eubacteriales bacterium]